MKVVSGTPVSGAPAASSASEAVSPPAATAALRATGASASRNLESAVLQPALEAARQAPEVNQVKVAELRDALARGALPFDANKLAALIDRYHRYS